MWWGGAGIEQYRRIFPWTTVTSGASRHRKLCYTGVDEDGLCYTGVDDEFCCTGMDAGMGNGAQAATGCLGLRSADGFVCSPFLNHVAHANGSNSSDPRLQEYFRNSWQAPTASPGSTTSSMAPAWSDPPTPRSPGIFVEPDYEGSPPVHSSKRLPLEQILLARPAPRPGPAPCWTSSLGQLGPCQSLHQKQAMATGCQPDYGQQGMLVSHQLVDEPLIPRSEQLPIHSMPELPSYRTALSIPERPRYPPILPPSEQSGHPPSQTISGQDRFPLGLPQNPCSLCIPQFDRLTTSNTPQPTAETAEVDEGFFEGPPILPAIKPLPTATTLEHMFVSSPTLADVVSASPSPIQARTSGARLDPVSDRDLIPHERMTSSESLNQILTTTLPSLVPIKSRAWVHGSPLSLPPPVEVPYGSTPMVREGGRIVNYKPLTLPCNRHPTNGGRPFVPSALPSTTSIVQQGYALHPRPEEAGWLLHAASKDTHCIPGNWRRSPNSVPVVLH
jgi:hypothetical protein